MVIRLRFAGPFALGAGPSGPLTPGHQHRRRIAAPGTLMEPGMGDVKPQGNPIPPGKIMHQLAMLAAKLGGCVNELFCSMGSFFQILGPFPIS